MIAAYVMIEARADAIASLGAALADVDGARERDSSAELDPAHGDIAT